MAPKQIQLCFLELANVGGYMASGQWRRDDDTSLTKNTLKYYTDLAKLAERGKISAIFFADWYAGFDVYGGGLDEMLNRGHQVAHLDPLLMIPAMAAVTENVSFAVTMSTTFCKPYVVARQFSTLDHITGGRCAWNIVTSHTNSSARAIGYDTITPHDERYLIADEFMDVVYKLWESSWGPEAVVLDRTSGLAFDARQIKKVEHRGKYHKVSGRSQVHPGPQRTPVLFQAGTSKSGTAFAAKHAEGIFMNPFSAAQAAKVVKEMREAASSGKDGNGGRDPQSLKFFPCFMPIIGRTAEEAAAKYAKAVEFADPIAGLAQISGYTGVDFAGFPLDEPFDLTGQSQATAIHAVLNALAVSASENAEAWTPRRLGMRMALGGLHPSPVGTAADVADVMQKWVEEADVDGFNIGSVTNPGSWTDVVDLLVPELQRRGLMWTDYPVPGGTFRENMLGGTPTLRDDHYGASFRWGTEKAKMVDQLPDAAPEALKEEVPVATTAAAPAAAVSDTPGLKAVAPAIAVN